MNRIFTFGRTAVGIAEVEERLEVKDIFIRESNGGKPA
jgi:hypothetical protein